jgi:hypothetical protein
VILLAALKPLLAILPAASKPLVHLLADHLAALKSLLVILAMQLQAAA